MAKIIVRDSLPTDEIFLTTDWMFTADPGEAGLGLNGRRVPVPRGKMLGGSSGINYMMYVRGHPGDFDTWAASGAKCCRISARARAWRRATRSSSMAPRTTPRPPRGLGARPDIAGRPAIRRGGEILLMRHSPDRPFERLEQ
jgi:hypothetical protein